MFMSNDYGDLRLLTDKMLVFDMDWILNQLKVKMEGWNLRLILWCSAPLTSFISFGIIALNNQGAAHRNINII